MPRFRFKLQALLDTARQEERNLQQDLVKARDENLEARTRLEDTARLLREWERCISSLRSPPGRTTEGRRDLLAPPLREQLRTVAALREHLTRQVQALRSAEQRADGVRRLLNEAGCRRKSLEKLRDRMKGTHDAEMTAHQTKLSDDMATLRAAGDRMAGRHDAAVSGASP